MTGLVSVDHYDDYIVQLKRYNSKIHTTKTISYAIVQVKSIIKGKRALFSG